MPFFTFLPMLLIAPFVLGLVIVSAYLRLDLGVKIALAPLFFLSFFILVYFVNVVSQRSLLANPLLLFSFFGVFLLSHGLLAWKARAREKAQKTFVRQSLSWIRIAQALLLALLIGSMIVLCLEANHYQLLLSGDIKRHLLFTRQILNGLPYSHYPPYDWAVHLSYPSLTHITIAFFKQLGQIQITTAYLLVYSLQVMLLPLGMFLLIRKLTGKYWIAILAVVLSCLYGGVGEIGWEPTSWWYNPAIERFLPHHVTRTLGLSVMPFFFSTFLSSLEQPATQVFGIGSILILANLKKQIPGLVEKNYILKTGITCNV